jgi:uncharacterized protein involved in exopolysaccharide biosynthesis
VNQSNESLFDRGWELLRRHIRLFLVLTLAGGATGVVGSYLFTPVYKADATLVASDEMLGLDQNSLSGGLSGLASLVGIGDVKGNKQSEAMAILKSRALTTAYIQTNNLLPVIFHDKWDLNAQKWKSDKKGKFPTLQDGFKEFDKSIRAVVENRKTNLTTISVTWEDPAAAKQWVEGIVDAANDLLRQQAIERSAKNLEYLQKASDKTSIMEVKASIYKLMESEIKKQMIATGNKDYAFRVVDPAVVPEKKSFPKRSLFAAFGALAGSMIWFLLVALKDRAIEAKQS